MISVQIATSGYTKTFFSLEDGIKDYIIKNLIK